MLCSIHCIGELTRNTTVVIFIVLARRCELRGGLICVIYFCEFGQKKVCIMYESYQYIVLILQKMTLREE
jgi:hypothetical protein